MTTFGWRHPGPVRDGASESGTDEAETRCMKHGAASAAAARAASQTGLTGAIVDHSWLVARRPAWDALLAVAEHPTVALSSLSVDAHIAHGLADGLRFVVVQDGQRLLAVLPFQSGRFAAWHRTARTWTSPYAINATPLVARTERQAVVEVLLDTLATHDPGGLWHLPLLSLDASLVHDLRAAVAKRGWPSVVLAAYSRATFRRRDHQAYLQDHLSRSERKNLKRRRNGLARLGRVAFGSATHGAQLAAAVERFLEFELSGWKGRRGTAMACRPATAAFTRHLFDGREGPVTVRADWISLDDRPIAVSLNLHLGPTACLLKTAYDERYAKFGPGVLLEHELVRLCCEGDFAEVLDSNSLAGELLDRVYPERETVGELLLATSATPRRENLQQLVRRELLWRTGLKAAKRVYWRAVDLSGHLRAHT